MSKVGAFKAHKNPPRMNAPCKEFRDYVLLMWPLLSEDVVTGQRIHHESFCDVPDIIETGLNHPAYLALAKRCMYSVSNHINSENLPLYPPRIYGYSSGTRAYFITRTAVSRWIRGKAGGTWSS